MNAQPPYMGDTTPSAVPALALGSIACSLLSAGIMAAFVPQPSPLGWSYGFLIGSVVLLLATIVSMLRRPNFVWKRFFGVAKWVLLMTLVITSMLGYVFIFDGMTGAPLAIMVVMLAVTAVDVPIIFGFSVARHERVQS
jgi:hypothetical protein